MSTSPASLSQPAIIQRLAALPPDVPNPEFEQLRAASVLVPLVWWDARWHLLYTRRTETVQSHKGQVAFPGGASDAEDASPAATALREAHEEIGLLPGDVEILGRLNRRPTISQFYITPIVARVPWPYAFILSPNEVTRVFTVPLDWLADPANHEEHPRVVLGGYYQGVIYYQPYDGEIVWGITARITLDLLEALGLAE
jgi:8-oxo-dGTP pyrophosphatase MutT (NUDIX family)